MLTKFQRGALWTATCTAALIAVTFAANALDQLFNHPGHTGDLYSFATVAAASAFAMSYLRGMLRTDDERQRVSVDGPISPAMLHAGMPAWSAHSGRSPELAPVRVERDCPFCAEPILVAAKLCKHCRSDVSGV